MNNIIREDNRNMKIMIIIWSKKDSKIRIIRRQRIEIKEYLQNVLKQNHNCIRKKNVLVGNNLQAIKISVTRMRYQFNLIKKHVFRTLNSIIKLQEKLNPNNKEWNLNIQIQDTTALVGSLKSLCKHRPSQNKTI